MKRIFIAVLCACLLSVVFLPAKVHADVVVELNDSFWKKHQDDCDYIFRRYTVNGREGYAVVWESPVSSKQEEILVNGTELYSNWHYTDSKGEVWCTVNGEEYDNVKGWIKTSECLAVPDHISFREAYEQEFVGYDSSYDHAFDGLDKVTLWAYPCSGIVEADHIDAAWFRDDTTPGKIFDTCWRDPQGRLWAFVGYCYGIRNTWICLDDPSATELDGESGADILPQDDVVYPPAEELPSVSNGVTWLTIGGVVTAFLSTGALLLGAFSLKKKK